jgi:hypothetical protein
VPSGITMRPGKNFNVAGFGVVSVSMNIGRSFGSQQGRAFARCGSPFYVGHDRHNFNQN